MANRWWCLRSLTHRATALLFSNQNPPLPLRYPPLFARPSRPASPTLYNIFHSLSPVWPHVCLFSSSTRDSDNNGDTESEDDDVEGSEEEGAIEDAVSSIVKTEPSSEDKEAEAEAIGYKVIGPLQKSDQVFKPFEPVFAVVQVGSHQFKVSNGDCIYTERLKYCDINDKLILNKVLLLGSSTQTIIGRPIVPNASVHVVVEEHALDAKVIIFKKKRRKNYRRTKGHRQELTRLRIIDIQGIKKPQNIVTKKPLKSSDKKPLKSADKKHENAAVSA